MRGHRVNKASVRFLRKQGLLFAFALVLGGGCPGAFALDPRIDPSRPSTQPPVLPGPPAGGSADTLQLPEPPPERAGPQSGGAGTILLKTIRFEGNEAVPTEDLEALARPYLGRRVSAGDLEQLRHEITLFYVEKGYVNSGAVIPEQDVEAGELLIRLVEGRLSEVRVTDITGKTREYRLWPLREGYIRDRLAGDPEAPLNTGDLQERYLMLLNDRLIERLNGNLLPGLHPGEAILDLKVTRARPYGGYLGVDNFSPPQIGAITGRVGFWVDNLTTLGERIDFSMSPTGGSFSYNTGIDIPLTASGTRFAFRYTNAETVLLEPPFNTANIVNNIISYDGQLSHPILWDLQQKLTLGMNFAVRQNRETVDGVPIDFPGSRDGLTQVTVFRAWQDYWHRGQQFDMAFHSTFSVGLDALGATISNNSQIGDGRFFAWLGQGVGRYRFLSNGAYVSLSGAVQVTGDRLLSLEKVAIGGFSTVRGFRQNYLVRDEGFFTSLEFGYPLYGGEAGSKYGVFLVPFMDYGGAWNQGESTTYIHSAGIGLEGHMTISDSTLGAAFYWAGRLTGNYRGPHGSFPAGAPYDAQDNGINFQVNWQTF